MLRIATSCLSTSCSVMAYTSSTPLVTCHATPSPVAWNVSVAVIHLNLNVVLCPFCVLGGLVLSPPEVSHNCCSSALASCSSLSSTAAAAFLLNCVKCTKTIKMSWSFIFRCVLLLAHMLLDSLNNPHNAISTAKIQVKQVQNKTKGAVTKSLGCE